MLLAAVLLSLSATAAMAQILHATGPRPSFEVATIKPTRPDETLSGMSFGEGGRVFLTTNATLRDLIQEAYNVKAANQIVGATGWMTADKFDISAKLEDAQFIKLQTLPMEAKIEQIRLMLQSLLEERFALQLTPSSRQSTFFSLVQNKSGSKLRPAAAPTAATVAAAVPADGRAPAAAAPGPTLTRRGPGRLVALGVSMNLLTDTLSRMPELGGEGGFTIGDLVVDKTNLTGTYDWSLTWTPDAVQPGADAASSTDSAPPLFTALQEQLGLKLEKTKGPVEVLVIAHGTKPSAN